MLAQRLVSKKKSCFQVKSFEMTSYHSPQHPYLVALRYGERAPLLRYSTVVRRATAVRYPWYR